MKVAVIVSIFVVMWVTGECAAFMDFSERMVPTFLLPLFDDDENGVLSNTELDVVRGHLPSFGFNGHRAHELMQTADQDGNGSLDEKEFNDLYRQIMAEQYRRIEERINKKK